jgi:hypothetical protein
MRGWRTAGLFGKSHADYQEAQRWRQNSPSAKRASSAVLMLSSRKSRSELLGVVRGAMGARTIASERSLRASRRT